MNRLHGVHVQVLAVLLVSVAGCVTLGGGRGGPDSVAGEWVDLHKSLAGDTSVWVLTPDGDDQLLHVTVGPTGIDTARRHFGRWSIERRNSASSSATLCFVRRPGRDAPSCVDYTLDTISQRGRPMRRLLLHGYAGEHHTGDRELVERIPVAHTAPRADSGKASAEREASGGAGAGAFRPQAVQPERPSVATHAGTVAPGWVELETGFEHDRNTDGTQAGAIPTVLKIGLTKRTQLSFQLPALGTTDTPFGLGDVAVGVKWRVLEDDPLLQDIAVLPQLKLSSGGPRGTTTTDASLLLINSRTIGPIGVDLNVGVTRRSGDGSNVPRTATLWTVAAGIPVYRDIGWALECYGYPGTGGVAGNPPIVAILTGPTFVLRPELELDFGVIAPVTGPQPKALYVGLVASLGKLFALPK